MVRSWAIIDLSHMVATNRKIIFSTRQMYSKHVVVYLIWVLMRFPPANGVKRWNEWALGKPFLIRTYENKSGMNETSALDMRCCFSLFVLYISWFNQINLVRIAFGAAIASICIGTAACICTFVLSLWCDYPRCHDDLYTRCSRRAAAVDYIALDKNSIHHMDRNMLRAEGDDGRC